jgi:hypothetical protein
VRFFGAEDLADATDLADADPEDERTRAEREDLVFMRPR